MDILNFLKEYYWDYLWLHKGYNIYNTITYAVIALIALYISYHWLKKYYGFNKRFMITVITFVLFGSTFRVMVDSYDSFHGGSRIDEYIQSNGLFTPVYLFVQSLHIYDYSPLTVTPGIYVFTAILFFLSIIIEVKYKFEAWKIGIFLWLPNFLLLFPLMTYFIYPVIILLLALGATLLSYLLLKSELKNKEFILGVFGHSLDGAATFVTIDIFNAIEPVCKHLGKCYGEQHVLPSLLGDAYGYVFFFALKVLISFLAVKIINDELNNDNLKYDDAVFFITVLMVLGLAPGLRDMLRVAVGA